MTRQDIQKNWKGKEKRLLPLSLFIFLLLTTACNSLNCPLNNRVYTTYSLAGDTLIDTLTISTPIPNGNDSVLINRNVNTTSFSLPISYQGPEDVFYLEIKDTLNVTTLDVITVKKEDTPHFEAVDCNPSFFHTITDVTYTTNGIDSIVINNPNVTYDQTKEHFHIYFKPRY